MKAFRFRLDQALSWREGQVSVQKSRVALAAAKVRQIEAAIERARQSLTEAACPTATSTGELLQSFAAFRAVTTARMTALGSHAAAARRQLDAEMKALLEANQRVRVLENLKSAGESEWRRHFERELSAFADEAFLARRA